MIEKPLLTNLFWDCSCEDNYIHVHTSNSCLKCNSERSTSILSLIDNLEPKHMAMLGLDDLEEISEEAVLPEALQLAVIERSDAISSRNILLNNPTPKSVEKLIALDSEAVNFSLIDSSLLSQQQKSVVQTSINSNPH